MKEWKESTIRMAKPRRLARARLLRGVLSIGGDSVVVTSRYSPASLPYSMPRSSKIRPTLQGDGDGPATLAFYRTKAPMPCPFAGLQCLVEDNGSLASASQDGWSHDFGDNYP